MNVLVVDDDFISLEVLKAMLSNYDVQISTAECGYDAVSTALKERPALILLDQELPDINGIDVFRHIHQELKGDTPLIAIITGHHCADFADQCHAAGIIHHMQKPLSPQHLADLMRIASSIE